MLMVLVSIVAVGMLTLSSLQMRASRLGDDRAEAMANARLALIIAIGELQKNTGPDQAVSAPSGILDSDPESPALDGLKHPHLTGAWRARGDQLNDTPDYDQQAPFLRWLVSNSDDSALKQLEFARGGSFDDRVLMATTPVQGDSDPSTGEVYAGRIPTSNGAMAWWVGDENCKARVNLASKLARNDDAEVAEHIAGFATPGPYGVNALEELESFPANTEDTDKLITRGILDLLPDAGDEPLAFFHHLTPYSESVLANVTDGSLRKDLNLYLERTDIEWLEKWARAEGVSRFPTAPLGPNGEIALSLPRDYDVVCWKTLHHWYNMHRRQIRNSRDLPLTAMDNSTASIDPVSNPGWNTGVLRITPVMVRMQMLLSYGVEPRGKDGSSGREKYQLFMYSYPVVTIWNPYNVGMSIPQWSVFLHTMPLEHTIKVNGSLFRPTVRGTQQDNYRWDWPHGQMVMRFGEATPQITLKPGEAKILSYSASQGGQFHAHDMVARLLPWRPPTHVGQKRDLGLITARPDDRITIETKAASWDTSGTSYGGQNFQTTFGFRCEPKAVHRGHPERFRQQMFSAQVCWRREPGNPRADTISENNFPSKMLKEISDAPTPFVHLDIRLKTLDEVELPNKTWLHNIPAHPYTAATSTSKHRRRGVDSATTFYAHPYTMSFEQRTTEEGLFQNRPFFGPSNTPDGLGSITAAEIPLAPITSLAQLQHLPQFPLEALNWSGYYFQNYAIGNSFASPGLAPEDVKERSFPFYLGEYFAWQAGDLTGRLYPDNTAFNNADYTIRDAPASVVDRSYAANHLLFDDYFFSSMAAHEGPIFRSLGKQRTVRDVVEDFYEGTTNLPNESYQAYLSPGRKREEVIDSLIASSGKVTDDAHLKVAAHLMTIGGFNVNSTSVEAWTAMLATAHLKRPVTLISGRPKAEDRGRFIVSRFSTPNGSAADNSPGAEEDRWLGYRELTPEEVRQLAVAIVEQVKKRAPFRSLGEFVNRRRVAGSEDVELARYGALQAALEDPDVEINRNYRGSEITEADIAGANYKFKEAALGSRYQGTPPYVCQADILTPLAPIINARSDTFLVRAYGEARSANGKTITARAWCEAVIQRVPDYIDSTDQAETAMVDLQSEANKSFGRRYKMKTFRWLSSEEVEGPSSST